MNTKGLLVDDDATYLRTLKRSLEKRGLNIETATNANDALHAARTFRPAFALVDLKLGVQSGLDLIVPLRESIPDAQIVLVTGYSSVATAVEAMKRGADDYLPKPVSVATILRVLEGQSATEEETDFAMTPLSRVEWEHIQQAMIDTDGNISAAARLLGMHRRSLQRKLAKRPSPLPYPAEG